MAEDDEDQHHGGSWTGPAAPMAFSILANDPSCQGILALTLRDALSQIQQEQMLLQPPATATATNGIMSKDENDNADDRSSHNIVLDDVSIQNILQAMGNAVAHTQQEHWKLQQQQQKLQQQQHGETEPILAGTTISRNRGSDDSNGKTAAAASALRPVQPPAALVRGRLDHYNRNNGKWRIVMDKVTFRRRMNLERGRRKSEKRSLWHVSRERFQPPPLSPPLSPTPPAAHAAGTDTTATHDNDKKMPSMAAQPSGITLQILAYNDLE